MLVLLGDIHFRDDTEHFKKISEAFLDWYKNWNYNSENNDLILLGDLVETAILSGQVVDYLYRFMSYSKFKSIHICVGNHDKKKINGFTQLSYDFYKNNEKICFYEELTETEISGHKVLILPYYLGINKYGMTMHDYYSDIPYNKNLKFDSYDLVVGHFCGSDAIFPGSTDYVDNLEQINTKHLILGHIHTRYISKERYIGSVFACKKSENDYSRSAIIIDDANNRTEEPLPLFNEFLTVYYPEDLPESKAIVPIYTVLNCSSESLATQRYGDIFIRRVTTDKSEMIQRRFVSGYDDFDSVRSVDPAQMLISFFLDHPEYDADLKDICLSMLKIK